MPQVGMYSGDPATLMVVSDPSGGWMARKLIGSYHLAAAVSGVQNTTSVIAGVADNLNCYPFFVARRWRVDRFAFAGGNAVAGARVRTGLYDSDPVTNLPRTLVYDNGETDVSGAAAVYETVIDYTFSPGIYWTCKLQNSAKTFRVVSATSQAAQLGTADNATFNHYNVYSLAYAYAALPATHPGGGTLLYSSTGNFLVMLRTLEG